MAKKEAYLEIQIAEQKKLLLYNKSSIPKISPFLEKVNEISNPLPISS